MNTLVHIVKLCAWESVAHAPKKKKKCSLKIKKIRKKKAKKLKKKIKKKKLHVHYKANINK